MIKDEFIEIKISKKNIKHFSSFYENIELKQIIKVKPEELQNNSNVKVNVKCDLCVVERSIKYQAYYKNINSCPEYRIYTCDRCSHIKIKEFNRKKWGVDYYSQTEDYNNKFRSTMKSRYGVEYTLQSPELKEKSRTTTREKWGYNNIFENKNYIKEKFEEKWGVDHPMKVQEIKEKAKESLHKKIQKEKDLINEKRKITNLNKWGLESYAETTEFKEYMKEFNLEKWGKLWYMQTDEFKEKSKRTTLENWGCDNYLKSEFSRINFNISKDPQYIKFIGNKTNLMYCEKCKNQFEIASHLYTARKKSGLENICTICNPVGDFSSLKEKDLLQFVEKNCESEVINSFRDKLEIDIYIPELNLGIEFNGLFWHSEEYKDRNYHLEKTNYFKSKGIRLVHIWEDDWDSKRPLIESQVLNLIGRTENKIFARKCEVKVINDSKTVRLFLEKNHIQGFVGSSLKIGLFFKQELVSLMTFDHLEGRMKMSENNWNLNRFCSKINTNVGGGASKLFSYFVNKYQPKRVISYADKDWSEGNLYNILGFEKVSESSPDYKYIVGGRRRNKQNYKKSNLNIGSELTETEFMKKSHILRIWDCGKIKYEKLF